MKKFNLFAAMILAASASVVVSCSDDDDETTDPSQERNEALTEVNQTYIETTLQPTYEGLAEYSKQMMDDLDSFDSSRSQSDLNKAADAWKEARQYWEWSEAFLFGAASGYGIDPHIDTWPFDAAAFNTYMAKYNPSTDESDAALLEQAIATGQNLTGFHAVEYLLFREGNVRNAADLTDDEIWFAKAASEDLFTSACKLVQAWGGKMSSEMTTMLDGDHADWEADSDFADEFVNAGQAGSRWATATLASVQIIEGCQDIIGEVAEAKIGSAYDGDDTNYIESPHAYNSVTDFYDNIMSCKNSLYALAPSTASYSVSQPAANSVMAYCQLHCSSEATAAMSALETALNKVNSMKRPFVLYYSDASAGQAIDALNDLDDALDALKTALQK